MKEKDILYTNEITSATHSGEKKKIKQTNRKVQTYYKLFTKLSNTAKYIAKGSQ